MVTFPCRESGAIGLATVKLIADDVGQALQYMNKEGLEFMTAYAAGFEIIDLRKGN